MDSIKSGGLLLYKSFPRVVAKSLILCNDHVEHPMFRLKWVPNGVPGRGVRQAILDGIRRWVQMTSDFRQIAVCLTRHSVARRVANGRAEVAASVRAGPTFLQSWGHETCRAFVA